MSTLMNLNYSEFNQILEMTPYNQNILIAGDHGIGKSEIVTNYYEDKGFQVETVFLGQMSDPGDLLGLPDKKEITVGEATTLIMDFLPPAWWQSEKPFCLFLDEINRGRPEIMQVIFDLCLNRRLGGRTLPEGSIVVAAANVGSEYQVTDLDPALVSRFNIYRLAPTAEEWVSYAVKQGVDQRITSFISSNTNLLDPKFDENADSLDKTPDRRAWFKVDEVLKAMTSKTLTDISLKMLAGVIGQSAVGLFAKHVRSMSTLDAKRLLYIKKFETLEMELQMMTMQDCLYLNNQVLAFVESKEDEISAKQSVQDLVCKNFGGYIDHLISQEMKEVVADLVNRLENNQTAAAMLISDDDVLDKVTDFIDDIELK
jgi:hypothetical protein